MLWGKELAFMFDRGKRSLVSLAGTQPTLGLLAPVTATHPESAIQEILDLNVNISQTRRAAKCVQQADDVSMGDDCFPILNLPLIRISYPAAVRPKRTLLPELHTSVRVC